MRFHDHLDDLDDLLGLLAAAFAPLRLAGDRSSRPVRILLDDVQ
jgi:hypothetical protein